MKCPRKPSTASWIDKEGRTITETYDFGPCDKGECQVWDEARKQCSELSAVDALAEMAEPLKYAAHYIGEMVQGGLPIRT